MTASPASSVPRAFPLARLIGSAMLLAGLVFLSIAIFRDARLALFGTRTEGKVIAVTEKTVKSDRKRRDTESLESYRNRDRTAIRYILDVTYTKGDGTEATFQTTATWGHVLSVGDKVPVACNSGRAEIDNLRQMWMPLIIGIIFSTLLIGGGLLLVMRRPSYPAPAAG